MLEFMRQFASTIWGKIIGGVLLIGLAGFGIQNVILDLGSDTIAKIGDDEITTVDFQRAYRNQIQAIQQQTGQAMTDDQALQSGIPLNVLSSLASNAAAVTLANHYGIGVSDAKLGEQVKQDPNYFGILGTFDRSVFDQYLQQDGQTEAQFFAAAANAAKRQQFGLGLFIGSPIPATALTIVNNYRNATRTVEYFTLDQTNVPDVGTPTDADLQAYLTAHQTSYRTPETRTVDVVYLDPNVLAPNFAPTEDEIKAEYDSTKDQLTTPEKRHIEQVVLSTPALVQAFTDAQTAGKPFADVVAANKVTPSDIGVLAKSDVTDPALADAAFSLAKAGDFTIIAGVAGKRAVGVTEIQPSVTKSYDDAKADIAKRLGSDKARQGYPQMQDDIENLRAALKPLKDIADRFKLPLETVSLTAGGAELAAVPGLAEADRAKIASAVFAATQGKLTPTITYGSTSNAWFDLSKIEPARDETLAEVHDKVATAWKNDKIDAALQAEVNAIIAELDAGKSFADVAAEKNQFVTTSLPINRGGDATSVLTPEVADKIFSTGPDSHGWALDKDGAYLVYHTADVTLPTGPPSDEVVNFAENSIRGALTSEFITGVTNDYWPLDSRGPAIQRMLAVLQPPQQ